MNGIILGVSTKMLAAMLAGTFLLAGLGTVGLAQSQAPQVATAVQPLEIYGDR